MKEGSGSVHLTNGSGSGRLKNIRDPTDTDPQHCFLYLLFVVKKCQLTPVSISYLAGFEPIWSRLEQGPGIPPLRSLPFLSPALRNADLFSSANPDNFSIWRRSESQDATTVILKDVRFFWNRGIIRSDFVKELKR